MPQHEYVLFRCQCNSNGMFGCVGAYTGVYAATYESPHQAIMRTCISDIFSVRKFSVCTFRQLVFERNSHCLPCLQHYSPVYLNAMFVAHTEPSNELVFYLK